MVDFVLRWSYSFLFWSILFFGPVSQFVRYCLTIDIRRDLGVFCPFIPTYVKVFDLNIRPLIPAKAFFRIHNDKYTKFSHFQNCRFRASINICKCKYSIIKTKLQCSLVPLKLSPHESKLNVD
jgi:hypothetical protein